MNIQEIANVDRMTWGFVLALMAGCLGLGVLIGAVLA